jgi:hypothetical protein
VQSSPLVAAGSCTFTKVKWYALLGSPTPAAGVADVARLLPGASRTTRIHVLSLTALVPTSILIDPILGSVLLLAGHGLLMIVRRSRLALLRLRVLSTLRLTSLNGVLAFLMRARPFPCLPAVSRDGCSVFRRSYDSSGAKLDRDCRLPASVRRPHCQNQPENRTPQSQRTRAHLWPAGC